MISVFGSSGFIGSRFVDTFKDKCIAIPRECNTPQSNTVLYLISTVDNYNVYTDPYLDVNTNLIKLINVLEQCKNFSEPLTFNFISSWFVYGKTNEFPAKETSICNPRGFYSITKYAAERMVESYCETFNINYKIMRLTNIIGPGDKKVSNKKNALQYMFNQLKSNDQVKLYNNGEVIRDYMGVDDCCNAIMTCIDNADNKSITNISNSEPTKIKDIINYAKVKLNSQSEILSIDTPQFHKTVQIENMYLDNTALCMLGYTPTSTVYQCVDSILKINND